MNNLKKSRKRVGMTQAQVAERIGLSQNQYSNLETGKSIIDPQLLIQLSKIYQVSIDYLLGEDELINLKQDKIVVKIPVLGTVAAGIPIDAIEEIVDWEEIPHSMAKTGEYFGLRIKGNSMEPRIMQGDTVIVRRQPDVESGEIAIVLVNGDEGTCKRIVKHSNGGISLIAFNSAVYEPHFYTSEDIQSLPITIVGKVIELRGKF